MVKHTLVRILRKCFKQCGVVVMMVVCVCVGGGLGSVCVKCALPKGTV